MNLLAFILILCSFHKLFLRKKCREIKNDFFLWSSDHVWTYIWMKVAADSELTGFIQIIQVNVSSEI